MPDKPSVCMIGSGGMLRRCIEIAEQCAEVRLVLAVVKSGRHGEGATIKSWCDARRIPCVLYERRSLLPEDAIVASKPDLLVSVYNMDILSDAVLLAAKVALNFHDGPLPRYAGFNAPSWALLNGEQTHGIVWHHMTADVDAGAVAAARNFTIPSSWTAIELSTACVKQGCGAFGEVISAFAAGTLTFQEQARPDAIVLNRRSEKPFGGSFPFFQNIDVLDRLRRATSYFPADNPFCEPQVQIRGRVFGVVRFRTTERLISASPGTVIGLNAAAVEVSVPNGVTSIQLMRSQDGTTARPLEFLKEAGATIGERLQRMR